MSEHRKVAVIRNPYSKKAQATNDPVEPSLPQVSAINKSITQQSTSRPSATIDPSLSPLSNKSSSSSSTACTSTAVAAVASAASALVISVTNKAGMDGIDRTRIDAIILRESGNSKFIQQQRKRDELVNEKIEKLRSKLRDKEKQQLANNKNGSGSGCSSSNSNAGWKTKIQHQMEGEIAEILASRPVRSTCVVVDMDMFYMACELLSRPDLHDKPACVGNGMILTSNYTARKFGVRSAMAGWIGDKLVEELSQGREKLIHVPSNFQLYHDKSNIVRQVLAEYDPKLRAMSLDEAYMDLGPYLVCKLSHPTYSHEQIRAALTEASSSDDNTATAKDEQDMPKQDQEESRNDDHVEECKADEAESSCIAMSSRRDCLDFLATIPASHCLAVAADVLMDMRQRVCQETGGLTCSAGLAPNFLLAKIASDIKKPNGQCLVPSDHASIVDFLHPLPIRKVSGIGRVTEKTLNAFGIVTVGDLYQQRALIRFLYENNKATTSFLLRACLGCGSSVGAAQDDEDPSPAPSFLPSSLSPSRPQKSISRDRTFSSSNKSWTELNIILEDLARRVSKDMVEKIVYARTIVVKVKLDTFDVLCKSHSLERGVYSLQNAEELVSLATRLFRDIRKEYEESSSLSSPLQNKTTAMHRRAFIVRLVGVRVSNFGEKTEENNSSLGGRQQETMDKFLSSSTQRRASSSPPRDQYDKQQSAPIPAKAAEVSSTSDETDVVAIDPTISEKTETRLDDTGGSAAPVVLEATNTATAARAATTAATNTILMVRCPICQQQSFSVDDNLGLNRHVDSCLSGMVVREVIQQQEQEEEGASSSPQQPKASRRPDPHNNKKKRRITDYW